MNTKRLSLKHYELQLWIGVIMPDPMLHTLMFILHVQSVIFLDHVDEHVTFLFGQFQWFTATTTHHPTLDGFLYQHLGGHILTYTPKQSLPYLVRGVDYAVTSQNLTKVFWFIV